MACNRITSPVHHSPHSVPLDHSNTLPVSMHCGLSCGLTSHYKGTEQQSQPTTLRSRLKADLLGVHLGPALCCITDELFIFGALGLCEPGIGRLPKKAGARQRRCFVRMNAHPIDVEPTIPSILGLRSFAIVHCSVGSTRNAPSPTRQDIRIPSLNMDRSVA